MNKDLVSNAKSVLSILPQALAASGTGSGVDVRGFDSAFVAFNFGAVTDGTFTPRVDHSDDGTTYSDAGTDGCLAFPSGMGTAFKAVTTAGTGLNGGTSTQRAGYTGGKPYVRAFVTVAGGTTGGLVSASVVVGHPLLAPVA